jgi:hypothetical protein
MVNPIVTVNVTQQVAPTPSALQKTGALVSQGATTTAAQAISFLTQLSDLTPILKGALAISTITWSASVATVTTSAPHGFTIADTIQLTIAGATPAGYNGTFVCTITGASAFTYPLAVNPGLETVPGTYTPEDVAELLAMATTFFAQGTQQGVYVLELGAGNAADGVTALTTFMAANANPSFFYSYLVPRFWDAAASFLTFIAGFQATTSKTYFYVTTTAGTYASYTAVMKCVKALVEAPGIPSLEFSHAADFQHDLNYSPSSTNKVTPNAYSFLVGVTAYPSKGNAVLLTALKAAFVNYVGTGAEGGISNTLLVAGTMMDGNDFTYWYSVDWVQINAQLTAANTVINGSNNPINPLYYNQDGINRLQQAIASLMSSGVSFGLVLGTPVQTTNNAAQLQAALAANAYAGATGVNADPFVAYTAENPSDYKLGKYAGITIVYVPSRGFAAIVFNVLVTQFVST